MSEREFTDVLQDALYSFIAEGHTITKIRTFQDAGLLTNNEGLVVTAEDGSQFQITVVQSRHEL